MKKILVMCLLSISVMMTAQRKEMKEDRRDLTPVQMAELQTKKMTLRLDLSEKQQKDVNTLFTQMATERDKNAMNRRDRKALSDAEKFDLKSQRLDQKIALKRAMRDILDDDQYARFEKGLAGRKRGLAKKSRKRKHKR